MHISDGFWMVAAALNTAAVWSTVPASQSRFRSFALSLILVSVLFAAAGFRWTGILAELLCVVLTNRAWQFRREWERNHFRAAKSAQVPGK